MNKKYQHGLMVARFQPLHKGHARVLKALCHNAKQVSIVIGSTQLYRTKDNPLTYEERKEILNVFLKSLNLNNTPIWITGMQDIDSDDEWSETVIQTLKSHYQDKYIEVDAYFSGAKEDSYYYKNNIKNIEIIDRHSGETKDISATLVRQLIRSGDRHYQNLIPACLNQYFSHFESVIK